VAKRIWPGKPGKPDPYPWRFAHVRKWPAEHWQPPFQGQLRTVSDADADLLGRRLRAATLTAA
jgi:hypothetical protein